MHEHAITLDTAAEARALPPPAGQRLHPRPRADDEPLRPEQLHVAIIGAGATGVELAAELHNTTRDARRLRPRPHRSRQGHQASPSSRRRRASCRRCPSGCRKPPTELLAELGVEVRTNAQVAEVDRDRACGSPTDAFIPAELVVWAAGVKAPDFLKDLDGLETNRINQLVVRATLQTTRDDEHLRDRRLRGLPLAAGDHGRAAWCRRARRPRTSRRRTWSKPDPAPAAPASRCAATATATSARWCRSANISTVGNLMGGLIGGSLLIEGWFARMMYLSLYKMHELALHGFSKCRARHAGADDHAAHRAACEAALTSSAIRTPPEPGVAP